MMTLQSFATHIATIMRSPAGDKFSLHPGFEVHAEIEIVDDDSVLVNNRWVGNREGAVEVYSQMVNRFMGIYTHTDVN